MHYDNPPLPPQPQSPPHRKQRAGVPWWFVIIGGPMIALGGCLVGVGVTASPETATVEPPTVTDGPTSGSATRAGSAKPTVKPKPKVPQITDGTWRVPQDVKPGTYRTTKAGFCYWARLRSFSGDLGGIITNGNGGKTETVTIQSSDKGFETDGCGTWRKIK